MTTLLIGKHAVARDASPAGAVVDGVGRMWDCIPSRSSPRFEAMDRHGYRRGPVDLAVNRSNRGGLKIFNLAYPVYYYIIGVAIFIYGHDTICMRRPISNAPLASWAAPDSGWEVEAKYIRRLPVCDGLPPTRTPTRR